MQLAPIILFVYNRPDCTKLTIEALKNNNIAKDSILYIYSDGAKNEKSNKLVEDVRSYLKTIDGFKEINLIERSENFGLAKNIIDGVTNIISKYEKVIVLEDDLKTSSNFLDFMNKGLNFYNGNKKIHSISGYTMPLNVLSKHPKDFYFGLRASSWGWATWDYVWNDIDWNVNDFKSFESDYKKRKNFNKGGSDMSRMLRSNISGKINSWAIVFCYNQWKRKRVTVFPKVSKVLNIGFSEEASNTKYEIPEFKAKLDTSNKIEFYFENDIILEDKIIKAFAHNFSYYIRLKNKFFNLLRSIS